MYHILSLDTTKIRAQRPSTFLKFVSTLNFSFFFQELGILLVSISLIHSVCSSLHFKYPTHYNTCITKDFTPKSAIFSIWGQSSTTWATFYPILTIYPLELTIVHILDNTYPLLKWPSVEFSELNTYRVSHIETCFLNWLWGVEGSIILFNHCA